MSRRGALRLSVRPTARGWQALVAGSATLLVARLIGTTQFHPLAYALLALPLASLVLGYVPEASGIRAPSPGSRITAAASLRLLLERSRFGATKASVWTFSLTASSIFGDEGEERIEVPLTLRARAYTLGPAEVRGIHFGCSVRQKVWRHEVVVYPRVHE